MKIDYIKINPTENKTVLVETVVERKYQAKVANFILNYDEDVEQVGFIESTEDKNAAFRLQMMGGEFCGNASISASVNEARKRGIKAGDTMEIMIEVSGVNEILNCKVYFDGRGYSGRINMPLPEKIEKKQMEYNDICCNITAVSLPGITHLILESKDVPDSYHEFAEKALKCWCNQFNEDAMGLILFHKDRLEIKPLVYVKQTDSLFWERGCGSGTAAIGAYYAAENGGYHNIKVKQPGGIIEADALYEDGSIKNLSITGSVIFEKIGCLEFDI